MIFFDEQNYLWAKPSEIMSEFKEVESDLIGLFEENLTENRPLTKKEKELLALIANNAIKEMKR